MGSRPEETEGTLLVTDIEAAVTEAPPLRPYTSVIGNRNKRRWQMLANLTEHANWLWNRYEEEGETNNKWFYDYEGEVDH